MPVIVIAEKGNEYNEYNVILINDRLSCRLRETTDSAQAGEKCKNERLQVLQQEMQNHLQLIMYPIKLLLTGKMGLLTEEQQLVLSTMQTAVRHILQMVTAERISKPVVSPKDYNFVYR